jgi:hypothetical protein
VENVIKICKYVPRFKILPRQSSNPSLLYPGNMEYYKLVLGSHLSEAYKLRVKCWNFKQSMGARNQVGIGLSYQPARLEPVFVCKSFKEPLNRFLSWRAESIPWNRFLSSLNVYKYGLRTGNRISMFKV